MLMKTAEYKARVGNDYRSGFPVLATMGWILVFKDAAFYQRKSRLRQTSEHPQS